MIHIVSLLPTHVSQVSELVNRHLDAIVPGWALPEDLIASNIQRNPSSYTTEPWIIGRVTLCAVERQRVCAIAHLLRYDRDADTNPMYRGVGDIAWFLAWPDHSEATTILLTAVQRQMRIWGVSRAYAWDYGLPFHICVGTPDVWPHIATALTAAGYQADADCMETLYGGSLEHISPPLEAPFPNLTIQRMVGHTSVQFIVLLQDERIGFCSCRADLTEGGMLPALEGWAELTALQIDEAWRNRSIGAWLVLHIVAWLRFGRCDRIIMAVTVEDELAGAGRFYQRFGWKALTRRQMGWQRYEGLDLPHTHDAMKQGEQV